jgi:hypothetical protein
MKEAMPLKQPTHVKRPVRFFNTTGPCNPWDHYMLPPEDRLVGAQLHRYIRDNLYWVLHAPRQTGKTTFLLDWMRSLNTTNEIVALYVSLEACQGVTDVAEAFRIASWSVSNAMIDIDLPALELPPSQSDTLIADALRSAAQLVGEKPLVVLFDETDVLTGKPLIRFLRLLREGFAGRSPGSFPTSIALVGMRDLKDYITAAKDGVAPNPGSPFNIKEDSAVLSNFSREDIVHLFTQRTEETGQKIDDDALDYVWEQSGGQPWIVNNLFKRATMRVLDEDSRDRVTKDIIMEARKQMILARETHLDALAYRLQDVGVRHVMETLISGETDMQLVDSEPFRLCLDLGLVILDKGTPKVANPIYREVLARQMTWGSQAMIPQPEFRWQKENGSLDMDALLKEFQKFWRRNADIWEQKSDYTEAFPHLLVQAFLQRVLNGGGEIEREYAAGRGRMDLRVKYNGIEYIIEIKIIHDYDNPATVKEEGLEQIERYRDKIDSKTPAYLMIFDRRDPAKKTPWAERITWEPQENGVVVVGG